MYGNLETTVGKKHAKIWNIERDITNRKKKEVREEVEKFKIHH